MEAAGAHAAASAIGGAELSFVPRRGSRLSWMRRQAAGGVVLSQSPPDASCDSGMRYQPHRNIKRLERNDMTNLAFTAAAIFIVIGAALAALGALAAGAPVWALIGLASILAGGGLALAADPSPR